MDCPKCEGKLIAEIYEQVEIDKCDKCAGSWLDLGEMVKIIEKQESEFSHELIEGTLKSAFSGLPEEEIESSKNCPHCQKTMQPVNYSYSSGIILDRCSEHGVWLEHEEIEKVQAHAESWKEKAENSQQDWHKLLTDKRRDSTKGPSSFKLMNRFINYLVDRV